MITSVFITIMKTIVSLKPEKGGYLFGDPETLIVTEFVFDENAHTTSTSFDIRPEFINPIIDKLWNEQRLVLLGIVHSHPHGFGQLSSADVAYFTDLLHGLKSVNQLIVPIVFSAKSQGAFDIMPFIIDKKGHIEKGKLEILPDDYPQSNRSQKRELDLPLANNDTQPQKTTVLEFVYSDRAYHTWFVSLIWALSLLLISLLPSVHSFLKNLLKTTL